MHLTDYTLRESQGIVERYLHNGACNTIVFLSAKMLVGAGIDEIQKAWIEEIDLITWNDAETLKKAGVSAKSRIHEVEHQEFIQDFLKRISKNNCTVYLLADSDTELKRLRGDLGALRNDLRIIGEMVVERGKDRYDAIVNEINIAAPVVIISRIQYDQLEHMMAECKNYLNAEVWLGLNYQTILNKDRRNIFQKTVNRWYRLLFHRFVNVYEQQKNEES